MNAIVSYAIFAVYVFVVLYTMGMLLYLGFSERHATRKRQAIVTPPDPAPINLPKAA
ncbi:MAG: hypothetical protein WA958_20430 [Tunicatimonas sp.]